MKILVFSDVHGRFSTLSNILFDNSDADMLICLGDLEGDIREVESEIKNRPFVCLKGNCDYFSSLPEKAVIPIEGNLLYCCHGHREMVKSGLELLKVTAEKENANIALFGHTHIQLCDNKEGILFINPGSVAKGNYCVLKIENKQILPEMY